MRTLGAGLLTLIATIAVVCAVPSLWAHYRVVDPGGFTSFVEPMATDRAIQDLIADELAVQISDQASGVVPSSIVEPATRAYTRSDQFPADFADVLSQQHDWLFTEPTTEAQRNGIMELNLTPMVNRVLKGYGLSGVRVDGQIEVALSESQRSGLEAGRYRAIGDRITQVGFGAAVVAVIAALLALVIARRRGFTLAALGVGVVVAAAISWLLGALMRSRARDEVAGAENSPRQVAELIIDKAVSDFHTTALVVGGAGVVAVALGILVSLIFERRQAR